MLQITVNSYEGDMKALHLSRTSSLVSGVELPTRARGVPKKAENTSGTVVK
jgi:hypothetical protein